MRLVDAIERERTPYERAWRRAQRTGKPSLYFSGGQWHATAMFCGPRWQAAANWAYAR